MLNDCTICFWLCSGIQFICLKLCTLKVSTIDIKILHTKELFVDQRTNTRKKIEISIYPSLCLKTQKVLRKSTKSIAFRDLVNGPGSNLHKAITRNGQPEHNQETRPAKGWYGLSQLCYGRPQGIRHPFPIYFIPKNSRRTVDRPLYFFSFLLQQVFAHVSYNLVFRRRKRVNYLEYWIIGNQLEKVEP